MVFVFKFFCVCVGAAQADDPGLTASLVSLEDILMLVLHSDFAAKMTWLRAELVPSILHGLRFSSHVLVVFLSSQILQQ